MNRLSEQQLESVRQKAILFQKSIVKKAQVKVDGERGDGDTFFSTLFRLAAEAIEGDVDSFCDRAESLFEAIEAFGQEPELDRDWLSEIVGENDNFYFSTENLVSDLVNLPMKKRTRLSDGERERFQQEVEGAIIDEAEKGQSFEQALSVAHGEDPNNWIARIKAALENADGRAELWQLREMTRLSVGELLLGLLLGQDNWVISQTTFYEKLLIHKIV